MTFRIELLPAIPGHSHSIGINGQPTCGCRWTSSYARDEQMIPLPFTHIIESTTSHLEEVQRLQRAIREHRDARGDDRCWMDDEALYKTLPEGYTAPARDTCIQLENCILYIKSRQNPGTVYVSPQRRIEELESQLRKPKLFIEPKINHRCLSCGHQTMFLSDDGTLCCSWLGCKSPIHDHNVKDLAERANKELDLHAVLGALHRVWGACTVIKGYPKQLFMELQAAIEGLRK